MKHFHAGHTGHFVERGFPHVTLPHPDEDHGQFSPRLLVCSERLAYCTALLGVCRGHRMRHTPSIAFRHPSSVKNQDITKSPPPPHPPTVDVPISAFGKSTCLGRGGMPREGPRQQDGSSFHAGLAVWRNRKCVSAVRMASSPHAH